VNANHDESSKDLNSRGNNQNLRDPPTRTMHISRKTQQRAERAAAKQAASKVQSDLHLPPRYEKLQDLVRSCEHDFIKFYDKGSKEAGIRLRKKMQELRAFAVEVRTEVQEQKVQTADSKEIHQ
jgi:hypothetical protein